MSCIKAPTAGKDIENGELVIVGTGLASIRQMTFEALSYIERADTVFYLVSDATTVVFIQEHNKNSFDLHPLYEVTKNRMDSYVQMSELMLRKVRQGELVVGVFYGHPGVFVNPSHRAIYVRDSQTWYQSHRKLRKTDLTQIAREEGYKAKMLPGISAEDCLFADLGIDPATSGCVSHEASAMLMHNKPIDLTSHLIIWQPGALGVKAMQFDNKHLFQLLDHLEKQYGSEHPVINYLAGTNPLEPSTIGRHSLKTLRDPEVAKTVTPASTFYLPPKELPVHDIKLSREWATSYKTIDLEKFVLQPTSVYRMVRPDLPVAESYGKYELGVIENMDKGIGNDMLMQNQGTQASEGMRKAAIQLALDHHRLQDLSPQQRLEALGEAVTGLTESEKAVVASGHHTDLEHVLMGKDDGRVPYVPRNQAETVVILIIAAVVDLGEGIPVA